MRFYFIKLLFLFSPIFIFANSCDTSSNIRNRKILVWSANSLAVTSAHALLYKAWYSNYAQSKFHWINDNHEWLQMDKVGHAWSSSALTTFTTQTYKWAGYNQRKSAVFGTATAMVFQFAIEYFDGRSAAWGASKGDLIANTAGLVYGGLQQYFWGKMRIPFQYSWHPTKYARIRPAILGSNLPETMLKDYNGQTYWIDINPTRMLMRPKWWPKFLGLALGYSVEGLVGGDNNVWQNNANQTIARNDIIRYRQYFISPSISFGYIHSKNGLIQTLAWLSDHIHLPLPTLEFNSLNKTKFHLFYW